MSKKQIKPGMDPKAREMQLTNLAVALAEKQLIEGTASPSVITHFLKLASTRENIEREILEKQAVLLTAKAESIETSKQTKEMYTSAIDAMTKYGGKHE